MKNFLTTFGLMGLGTLGSYLVFLYSENSQICITMIYILCLFLVARYTEGYWCGILSSIYGVICVNFLYTYPYHELNFTLEGYPITFAGMLSISLITSTMTTSLKKQAFILAENEKQLMEAEKEKMRANLLRAVSHDLRTPLTGIMGACSSLIDNPADFTPNEQLTTLTHIREDADWLLGMVENLLSVTRIDDTTASVRTTEELVEEVVSEAVTRTKKRFPNSQIDVSVPEDAILVPMDPLLIEQVMINLLQNALLHAKSPRPISLFVTESEDQVTFHVRDYGIGINPNQLSTIFDGDSTRSNGQTDGEKGMGIGLSICKTIILAHHGDIGVTCQDPGAEFFFWLPKQKEA